MASLFFSSKWQKPAITLHRATAAHFVIWGCYTQNWHKNCTLPEEKYIRPLCSEFCAELDKANKNKDEHLSKLWKSNSKQTTTEYSTPQLTELESFVEF
jgi:hypothetical protein